ncbi:hypothetical protein PHLCEN_2v1074 [Hermanssonia centrifuga]|uniref:RRM domain-containing protein n=1 Tax=Hermanssonia centrifuga TaxID=98765 RepID=A0A2R6S457_9APHY|nr:hypothetical protein PHLCEN_2v1074 [Hermanssonia centrifuga]
MSASTYDVHVANIAPQTTEHHLHDFFTFCGKITTVHFDPTTHSATIHFEKSSAAKTALMLNGGTLDGEQLSVTSPTDHQDDVHHDQYPELPIDQTDKPRAGIAAEYLARGYKLSDQVLQRAIEIDSQKGISTKFLSYIQSLDSTLGQKALGPQQTISGALTEKVKQGHERAMTLDQEKGISAKAGDYYSRALSSPFGQKVKAFYTTTSKQVLDIHEEAKRIAASSPQSSLPHGTPISTGVGTTAPPLDSSVIATDKPLIPETGAQELKPKTTEAPTVV